MVTYRFGPYELDLSAAELRRDGQPLSVEPQVVRLLAVLIGARGRVVPREELIQRVWQGRAVADATLASRVKSARQAVGDDGSSQRVIRTVHGEGYRFIATLLLELSATAAPPDGESAALPPVDPPGIVVLPLSGAGDAGRHAFLATALPHELIASLARLRWLCVTARGSAFRIDPVQPDFSAIGRLLQVRYCLSGDLMVHGRRIAVMMQLVDTGDARVIWAERFDHALEDLTALQAAVLSRTLAAIDVRIPQHEAVRARRQGTEHLDAWSAFHLGLQEAYRFRREHRGLAASLFERAIALDPSFARAHSALSFLHFQTAFLRDDAAWSTSIDAARRHAERGVELDPLDPFVNFTMGRCHWLEGDVEGSLSWLGRSVMISPHYAHGIYASGWSEAMLGNASAGRRHADLALRLSPLDPLQYAMLCTRALTHIQAGEHAEAAAWARRAAESPDAHVLIELIAAAAYWLAGDATQAHSSAGKARARQPGITREHFFRSFPMRAMALRQPIGRALEALGI